jgi:hypothetical protein
MSPPWLTASASPFVTGHRFPPPPSPPRHHLRDHRIGETLDLQIESRWRHVVIAIFLLVDAM